jgi:hypothetical protein
MGFKMKSSLNIDWTSVFRNGDDEGKGINGVTTNCGNIIINKNMSDPEELTNTISHEMVHVDQIRRGDLNYDDKYIYWKGKKYSRNKLKEGDTNLPWEKEAYKKEIPIKKKK